MPATWAAPEDEDARSAVIPPCDLPEVRCRARKRHHHLAERAASSATQHSLVSVEMICGRVRNLCTWEVSTSTHLAVGFPCFATLRADHDTTSLVNDVEFSLCGFHRSDEVILVGVCVCVCRRRYLLTTCHTGAKSLPILRTRGRLCRTVMYVSLNEMKKSTNYRGRKVRREWHWQHTYAAVVRGQQQNPSDPICRARRFW